MHWRGWLPLLSSVNGVSPWTATAGEAAVNMLDCALGAFSARVIGDWEAPAGVDWDAAVWTDESLIFDGFLVLRLLGLGLCSC